MLHVPTYDSHLDVNTGEQAGSYRIRDDVDGGAGFHAVGEHLEGERPKPSLAGVAARNADENRGRAESGHHRETPNGRDEDVETFPDDARAVFERLADGDVLDDGDSEHVEFGSDGECGRGEDAGHQAVVEVARVPAVQRRHLATEQV